jgi:hypothetical protein
MKFSRAAKPPARPRPGSARIPFPESGAGGAKLNGEIPETSLGSDQG